MDFTNFYGFVKKMVQKNQYTYNIFSGSSANPYGEARSAKFDGTGGPVDGNFFSFNFLVSTFSVPSGSRADLHDEARKAKFTDGWIDGWTGWDGISKVSFKFLYTL